MVDFYIVCAIVIAVSIFFLILTVKVIMNSERKKEFVFDEEGLEMITLYDWHLRRKSETIYSIKNYIRRGCEKIKIFFRNFATQKLARDLEMDRMI